MSPPWLEFPSSRIATTIDLVGEDLLLNIVTRLPALSFASAACVSRSWNLVCNQILFRPKLSSACVVHPSLQVAIESVVNKVLSEPIRPHFAIAYVGPFFNLQEAHQLITAKLGSKVPIVTNRPAGIIGRDEFYDEFKEEYKFVTDIREFSTSISGCNSPAAIMMFGRTNLDVKAVMELMDYFMSPETVIVGDCFLRFHYTDGNSRNITVPGGYVSAVALVYVHDRNKPLGN
ncbi:hypothetical protein M8C21_002344 [Ambrosia artemisiifolia]|uniref:F-box domain-containing protein n=1 Tax=Ambrosia artemisiifolia TaxID=4212 RepID=A0AAD5BNS4_AMBAR|nr:hypothetical protein M8C21_002344 [Ambrosia artemisiifolia]